MLRRVGTTWRACRAPGPPVCSDQEWRTRDNGRRLTHRRLRPAAGRALPRRQRQPLPCGACSCERSPGSWRPLSRSWPDARSSSPAWVARTRMRWRALHPRCAAGSTGSRRSSALPPTSRPCGRHCSRTPSRHPSPHARCSISRGARSGRPRSAGPRSQSTGRQAHPSRGAAGHPTFPPIACVVLRRFSWRQVQSVHA